MVEGGLHMSQSRRSGRPGSRPAKRQPTPPLPVPASPVERGWGYNLDYLLAARFGGIVPPFVRNLFGGTDEGESDCLEVARRVPLSRDRLREAMDFASSFWLFMVIVSVGLVALVVCGIAAIDHNLLGTVVARIITAVNGGAMTLSMIAVVFSVVRKMWLDDPVVLRYSKREVPGLATPKPYDWIIILTAGVLGAVLVWAGVADGIARAQV